MTSTDFRPEADATTVARVTVAVWNGSRCADLDESGARGARENRIRDMAHQNTTSSTATRQNAATDPAKQGDQGDGHEPRQEPRSYAAPDALDASLAPPAAGEIADEMDEGEALAADDMQQGATNRNRPDRTEKQSPQGPETVAANRERLKGEGA